MDKLMLFICVVIFMATLFSKGAEACGLVDEKVSIVKMYRLSLNEVRILDEV